MMLQNILGLAQRTAHGIFPITHADFLILPSLPFTAYFNHWPTVLIVVTQQMVPIQSFNPKFLNNWKSVKSINGKTCM